MREILFRGKRVDNGEWIEGYFAKSGDRTFIIIDNDFAVGYVKMKEVVPETVGQYSGVEDKDDNSIYKDDIVRFDYVDDDGNDSHEDFVIIFANGAFRAQYLGNLKCAPHTFDEIGINECYVVGNIHDNPELLQEDEQ